MNKVLVIFVMLFSVVSFSMTSEEVCGDFYVPVFEEMLIRDLVVVDTILVFTAQIDIPANTKEVEIGNATVTAPIKSYDRFLTPNPVKPYKVLGLRNNYPASMYLRSNVRINFERAFNDEFDIASFTKATDGLIVICTRRQPPEPI